MIVVQNEFHMYRIDGECPNIHGVDGSCGSSYSFLVKHSMKTLYVKYCVVYENTLRRHALTKFLDPLSHLSTTKRTLRKRVTVFLL